ncbi:MULTISPECIES: helix-turn-helix domain-containing protein [unclassified Bacillus (in: firmicutes)]|uniref:helix-turn-helix domain-containing protein n=1 Tax=unclassified Bacillus (in: firmicutes) TaxID=185979 RepID=UPI0004E12E4B|nr:MULTISPECIES: helix-turn-helix domain-containing protein [unclassified Bacillus (in: firmicutes)]CAI9396069.1 HTH-type transcriptional activator RhaS [Bacillus sp. T2.9-1]
MFKILIADRDRQEVNGIEWLVSKYSSPDFIMEKRNELAEVLAVLETDLPDILFIELDMIPDTHWKMVQSYINRYAKKVVTLTAETTFERAMQAMSVKAVDLLVKPLTPNLVKKAFQELMRMQLPLLNDEKNTSRTAYDSKYEALFIDDMIPYEYPVFLIESEWNDALDEIRVFSNEFDFYYKPVIFSTSDHLVLAFQHELQDEINEAKRFLREWEIEHDAPLAIAISHRDQHSLYQTYNHLRKAINVTFYTGYRQVILANDFHDWVERDPFLTMEQQRDWVHMLDEKEISEIKAWMYGEFFSMKSPYPSPSMLRTRLTSILAQVRRFMIKSGLQDSSSENYYKDVFNKILNYSVLYRIVQEIILFIDYLFDIQNQRVEKPKLDIMEAAITYMEKNYYRSDLSLVEVANHIGRSPSYFSYLLTNKNNRSFREILTNIRIQKAKDILSTSDTPIQNTAKLVGFNNPNYFSRIFRKQTGLSPREFIRQQTL